MPDRKATTAEVLTALSRALDLVEGQPEGHAARTCLIAHRLGGTLGLGDQQLDDLFIAALIKDSGCSSNSARIHKMFGGDELVNKFEVKLVDWSSPLESVKFAFRASERQKGLAAKLVRLLQNIAPPDQVMAAVTEARCYRASEIACELGLSSDVADALYCLDEHWDGRGAPHKLRGDKIPVLARVLSLAQTLDVFVVTHGVGAGMEMVRLRSGKWFDPAIAQAALQLRDDVAFWHQHSEAAGRHVLETDLPATTQFASAACTDAICRAFAGIVDAKSQFTSEHSSRVTDFAMHIGRELGLDADRLRILHRASLLHDLGKLGVSNDILEKPGRLTDDEFALVRRHPEKTYDILLEIPGFDRIAEVAAAHHEKLDGRGYWRGLTAEQLDQDMRILTVADIYDALTADRPYRPAMPKEKAVRILREDAVCQTCVDIVEGWGQAQLAAA